MINLVVACSDTKRERPHPALKLRALYGTSVHECAREWIERLKTAGDFPGLPAHSLYAGVYWAAIHSLFTITQTTGGAVDIWVCSAGYGLIPIEAPLRPYSATFTPKHPDSVSRVASTQLTTWWRELTSWKGPLPGAPRSLHELAASRPDAAMVVAAGPHYLRAVQEDLRSATSAIADGGRLILLSAGSSPRSLALRGLETHLMRADARWLTQLGGTRIALNGKLAAELLTRSRYQADGLQAARESMEREHGLLEPHMFPRRSPQTEGQIQAFIERHLRKDPRLGHTVLLRQLRSEGKAFEYRRFRNIYHAVQDLIHASKV